MILKLVSSYPRLASIPPAIVHVVAFDVTRGVTRGVTRDVTRGGAYS